MRPVVVELRGRIRIADLEGVAERARAVLEEADALLVVCDVRLAACDVVTVDALARLCLTARRLGRDLRLGRPSDELIELIAFMGLADVLGA